MNTAKNIDDIFSKLIAESKQQQEQRKATKKKQREMTRGKREKTDVDRMREQLDALIEAEKKAYKNWPVEKLVIFMQEIQCRCGSLHTSPGHHNLFLLRRNPKALESTWRERYDGTQDLLQYGGLPKEVIMVCEEADVCWDCIGEDFSIADILLSPPAEGIQEE